MNKFFVHEIKGLNNVVSNKGIVVADTFDNAKQVYHAYLAAYAYNHDAESDFVSCMISDGSGSIIMSECWHGVEVE